MNDDFNSATELISKMAAQNVRIKTAYNVLRAQSRYLLIGDYPLICFIVRIVSQKRKVTAVEITRALKQSIDGEFKNIHRDNDLVTGIYSGFESNLAENNSQKPLKSVVDDVVNLSQYKI